MIEYAVNKVLRQVRLVAIPGVIVLLAACSYTYNVRITVVPGEQVGIDALVDVSIIIARSPHQPEQLSSMTALPVGDDGIFNTEICCVPNPDIWIYVFHDANGSGNWDADEPLVADNNSPVRLTGDYSRTLTMP